ncbi:hypothetical protein D046_5860A, partial [Vibrio parahaemolyticus V-223/04]
MASFAIAHLVA